MPSCWARNLSPYPRPTRKIHLSHVLLCCECVLGLRWWAVLLHCCYCSGYYLQCVDNVWIGTDPRNTIFVTFNPLHWPYPLKLLTAKFTSHIVLCWSQPFCLYWWEMRTSFTDRRVLLSRWWLAYHHWPISWTSPPVAVCNCWSLRHCWCSVVEQFVSRHCCMWHTSAVPPRT